MACFVFYRHLYLFTQVILIYENEFELLHLVGAVCTLSPWGLESIYSNM